MNINKKDIFIIGTLFSLNVLLQFYNINKLVNVFTDEGVYLYSAKLISNGLIPYKDFFLAQPPFLIFIASLLLKISNFDLNMFHYIYTLIVLSTLFPLYFITLKMTNSRASAIISVLLFSTYSELVQWDIHSFALRQFSLPMMGFGIFFLYVDSKPRIACLLLGLFAISLLSNFFVALAILFSFLLGEYFYQREDIKKLFRSYIMPIAIFNLITIGCYALLLFIQSAYDNILFYQLNRPSLPINIRLEWINHYFLKNNWPILLFGLIGSFIFNKKARLFGLFNVLGILSVIFLGTSFYPHYLTILSIGLAIGGGILITIFVNSYYRIIISLVILLSIYISSYVHLKTHLIDISSPEFFQVINVLKNTQSPLFTFEPIYSLYANKELTFHYHVADMRYFRVVNRNLTEEEYAKVLQDSKTILLEPFMLTLIPSSILDKIKKDFKQIYNDQTKSIYVKK